MKNGSGVEFPISDLERGEIRSRVADLSSRVRFPRHWSHRSGLDGRPVGSAAGSSLEFRDHRPYILGDDYRHIDWTSSARTTGLLMKVFEEDRAPAVDLILDCSPSMWYSQTKARIFLEVAYLFDHVTARDGISLRTASVGALADALIREFRWNASSIALTRTDENAEVTDQNFAAIPLRHRSVRILVSDLLFPLPPEQILRILAKDAGAVAILSIYTGHEENPDFDGSVELLDAESLERQRGWIDRLVVDRYQTRYRDHFSNWDHHAALFRAIFLRVSADDPLTDTVVRLANAGAIEMRS